MSTCSIIEFRDGLADSVISFRNSWFGAARIWTALYDTYLKNPDIEYDSWMTSVMRDPKGCVLWQLWKRQDLPFFERIVLFSTMDAAMIRQENFSKFAGHLREFAERFPVPAHACHLKTWADYIEKSDAEAIAFHGNSMSDNHWLIYVEGEEGRPYNLNRDTNHFEIYEDITKFDNENQQTNS